MTVIIIEVELFGHTTNKYKPIEAIVDTGASTCCLSNNVADKCSIGATDITHHWQAGGPLICKKSKIDIRYKNNEYNLEASYINIDKKFFRDIESGEECTRPEDSHPLTYRIILGLNFIDSLSKEEKRELIGMLIWEHSCSPESRNFANFAPIGERKFGCDKNV